MSTEVPQFIADLNAGVFEQTLALALSEVAAAVIDNGSTGHVTVKFDLRQISQSTQVAVKHKLSYTRPTSSGKRSEEATHETPMYVGKGGKMTFFPENQNQMFTKTGEINPQASN